MGILGVAARKLKTAVRLLREDPGRLARTFKLHFEPYIVFSARTDQIAPPAPIDGVTLRRLTPREIVGLLPLGEEIRDGAERCHAMKDEAAYGAFCHGEFAHLSWLIPAERDPDRALPRLVKLRPAEAEITFCVTLPQFRGRRIYPFVIRSLFQIARERGIREIFMITKAKNVVSQHGILKAGLSRRRGGILHFRFLRMNLVYRGFRLRP